MTTIEEKRVYADQMGAREVYVASALGVAVASVADDRLGGFELVLQGNARDVAASSGHVAVATDEDVLVNAGDEDDFEPTNFGPATAVGFDGETLVAAGDDGRVARRGDGVAGEGMDVDGEWTTVGELDAEIRAIAGDMLATDAGMFRVAGDDLQSVGLADVRDVSIPGIPLAATADGLYKLGNGWMDDLDGDFRAVAANPDAEPGSLERAHAATPDAVFAHRDGAWVERDLPIDETVVALAISEAVFAVTDEGSLLVDAGDGWRVHPIGVREPRRIAVA